MQKLDKKSIDKYELKNSLINMSDNRVNFENPELLTFAQRRALYANNLQQQEAQFDLKKRRQSEPAMPKFEKPIQEVHIPPPENIISPAKSEQESIKFGSIVPPPQQESSLKPVGVSPQQQMEEPKKSHVVWVSPDSEVSNPLGNLHSSNEKILSNEEAFNIARQRRASDSAILAMQKMELQNIKVPEAVSIPPPPSSPATTPQPQPVPVTISPPQPAEPETPHQIDSTPLPKFGSVTTTETHTQKPQVFPKKEKDEIKPQAFKNGFAFFANLTGQHERRMTDDQQIEIQKLEDKLDNSRRKRAVTDNP